tara:strand:- start:32 stop:220 length:189 start_codon:yes stop_codon:yes gene_type:complete
LHDFLIKLKDMAGQECRPVYTITQNGHYLSKITLSLQAIISKIPPNQKSDRGSAVIEDFSYY